MRKELLGQVISIYSTTAKVAVSRIYRHKKYHKEIKVVKSYLVDTGKKSPAIGDRVLIVETPPISKRKHFRIVKIIKKNDS